MLCNKVIDTSCQKGSIRKMAGVWEHTALMWSALKDTRLRKKSLVSIWLDLANAYGSVPHKLIEFALKRYKVPAKWTKLILDYYDGLYGRASGIKATSDWFRLEKGIFAGCTVSVILFLAAFNTILEFVLQDKEALYCMKNGNLLPLLRAFMDDVSILTTSVPAAIKVLKRFEMALDWARMAAKPAKSRSCVIKMGRCMNVEPFVVKEVVIPSIQKKPVKSLGRIIDGSLRDKSAKVNIQEMVVDGIGKIDKSMLTGIMKVFTYQNLLLPKVCWPLMIYEIPSSFVEKLEPYINRHLRKW